MRLGHDRISIYDIKEIYVGQDKVFGFRSDAAYLLSFDSTDDRVSSEGVSDSTGWTSIRGFDYDTNAYFNVNAVCCSMLLGLYFGNLNSTSSGLDIYIKNFYTGDTLYRYRLGCSSYSSQTNFTLKSELFDKDDNLLKSGTWKTDYGFTSTATLKYDFENHQFEFPILKTVGSSGAGGLIDIYTIDTDYIPFKIEVHNISGKRIRYFAIDKVEVQD